VTSQPLAIGYAAPLHGRGATGFILGLIFSVVVVIVGAAGTSVPLVAFGVAGVLGFGAGLSLYWRAGRSKPAIRVFADRVEFLRGHRTGAVPFGEVTDVRAMQWGGSIYPYTRASRFLILETADGEWQFGPEVANCLELQETLVRALNRWRENSAGA
jgi:hypothetical protein